MGPVRRRPEEIWREYIEKANLAVREFLKAVSVGPNWARLTSEMETFSMVWGHDLYDDLMAAAAAEGYEPAAFEALSRSYAEEIIRLATEQFSIPFVNPQDGMPRLFERKEKITQYLVSALARPSELNQLRNKAIYRSKSVQSTAGPDVTMEPLSATPKTETCFTDDRHRICVALLEEIIRRSWNAKNDTFEVFIADFLKGAGFARTAFLGYRRGKTGSRSRSLIESRIIEKAMEHGIPIPEGIDSRMNSRTKKN